jgi:hypothetical protein
LATEPKVDFLIVVEARKTSQIKDLSPVRVIPRIETYTEVKLAMGECF